MNINATLLGQMLTFAILVWVTMKYIWPPILHALEERRQKIAAGLRAAEQGRIELEQAVTTTQKQMAVAREQADGIIKQAGVKAEEIIEEARLKASAESDRILAAAQIEIKQETQKAKAELLKEVINIAINCTEHILERNIQADVDTTLLNKFISDQAQ